MWWVWLLVSLLIVAAIVVIVLLVLYAGKCKKSFTKAFGDKNGPCLFDAAKKSLSAAHFKTVCSIVENCPNQLHECGQLLVPLLMQKLSPPVPEVSVSAETPSIPPDAWDKLMKLCPDICITKYINVASLTDDEKQQWVNEAMAMGDYLEANCPAS
jgi:hypothetical protein